ncbi:MAG: anthranilate synthase component I family protein [Owenweeksia sp.]|nr:anthranilate synthase component I family protein [Owenweeksia sp.]
MAAPLLFCTRYSSVPKEGQLHVESILYQNEEALLKSLPAQQALKATNTQIRLKPKTSRTEYLEKVGTLKDELQYGNIYEINYCLEFAGIYPHFEPLHAFQKLNESARAPFSAFYHCRDQYLICASPERYLQKTGRRLISQPIKGTAPRSADPYEDQELKDQLRSSEKEQSENVMITDLVRNDLSRTASLGSVVVDELFGIYSFASVHQMISTVHSDLHENYDAEDALRTSFPMGSMTGAPKLSAMQLIDQHENFARSLYAGTVGYFSPSGDFDFNVVIRSLFFHAGTGYLSARVGSAITIHCEADKEYDECLLKAKNLFQILEATTMSPT